MLGMLPQHKKTAQTIVARQMADGGEVFSQSEIESDDNIALKAIGEEVMQALEKKDALAFADGIKTLFLMIQTEAEVPEISQLED